MLEYLNLHVPLIVLVVSQKFIWSSEKYALHCICF